MSNEKPCTIRSKAEFLAHADALFQESEDRYEQMADSMATHNNLKLAELFRELLAMAERRRQWLDTISDGITLPQIAPWEFIWHRPEDPGSLCFDDVDYLSNTAKVLTAALANERFAHDFYRAVAEQCDEEPVRELAKELVRYQAGQCAYLEQRLEQLSDEEHEVAEDLDPPNTPE